MKRIEVKLSLPVVAPLLDVIRQLADGLGQKLAAPQDLGDIDQEFRDAWVGDLLEGQNKDVKALLALFDDEFFAEGIVAFDEENAEPIVRACAAVRLRLREVYLKGLDDDALEGGEVELEQMSEAVRKAFMCYLFLATVQELIIQHLDSSIIES
ncbi:MAG: hypothetical protein B9S26_02355 [Opitutia bacterium Tous-C4FEB]|jgi:hypothetical protein|nr:hypothetical protein [Verrucomicrobiota bacterium]PAW74041.1 MAG: hypothetical protein B9S35_03825 [Opitutae bacterium Tous-C5TDCM]PAW90834.1 MAG: hypothetical protein B9S26_02355 [Opitutae bacterium Tous-C4FEB]